MLKFRIDYNKTHLPMSMVKGTTEQRLHLARLMNLRFFDNLQDSFKGYEVKPGTFKKVLRETVGYPIRIDIAESLNPKSGEMHHVLLGDKGIVRGYSIALPLTYYYKNIHQSTSLIFLQETQKFFEEILNPKFFKRFLTMLGKGYNMKEITDFYQANIHNTQKLTAKSLDKFLQNKSTAQKIDILQFFRYQLLKEQNSCAGIKGIEERIAKYQNLKYNHSGDFYSFKEHDFEEKFALLESRLKHIIQTERTKNKNSVL